MGRGGNSSYIARVGGPSDVLLLRNGENGVSVIRLLLSGPSISTFQCLPHEKREESFADWHDVKLCQQRVWEGHRRDTEEEELAF